MSKRPATGSFSEVSSSPFFFLPPEAQRGRPGANSLASRGARAVLHAPLGSLFFLFAWALNKRGRHRERGATAPVSLEKLEHTSLEFLRVKPQRGGVVGVGHNPQLLGAARGVVNHLRVPARQGHVLFIADQQHRKRPRPDRFRRRNFG